MLLSRLQASNRAPSAKKMRIGFVKGRTLTFNKKSTDGSGKCTMEVASHDRQVYGVLYEISSQEKVFLDKAEVGYGCERIDVITDEGTVTAVTYIATKTEKGLKPTNDYLRFVVDGAIENRLPAEHIEMIRQFGST